MFESETPSTEDKKSALSLLKDKLSNAKKTLLKKSGLLASLEDRSELVNKVKKDRKVMKYAVIFGVLLTSYMGYRVFATTFAIIDRSGKPDALALQDSIRPDQLNREGDGRVNILLIGVGGGGHTAGDLSDVNHIVSIDPFNHKAAVLGIPRDFYVPIPGYYSTRINAAHAFGERDGGKGAQLAQQTIENALGVPIHYYAKVDFNGFQQAVDAVGGVDVEIEERLYDPSYPNKNMSGSEVFELEAGKHHLNGEEALKVARCRKGTCGNDFGRADRQQKIMVAVKDKAMSLGTLSNPSKISKLLDTAGEHARTDISLSIMAKLVDVAKKLDEKKVKPETFVLNTDPDNYLVGANVGGASVLVPRAGPADFSQIQNFIRSDLFRDGFLAKENAKIAVINSTAQAGLANGTATTLNSYGYEATAIQGSANSSNSKTSIYKISDKKTPFTTALLQKRLRKQVSSKDAPSVDVDLSKYDYLVVTGVN